MGGGLLTGKKFGLPLVTLLVLGVSLVVYYTAGNHLTTDKAKEGERPSAEAAKPVAVYLAGDSTMQSYTSNRAPLAGWGQMLGVHFTEKATIRNHAMSGRSSKSFIDEGLLDTILGEIGAGDYLFIQFAHNDENKEDPTRFTEPNTTFKTYLKQYIDAARAKGANPVLITPMERRTFSGAKVKQSHASYAIAIIRLGEEENVPVIPLHAKSIALLEQLGEERSKSLFLWLEPGQNPNYPQGIRDDTHFNEHGAAEMAKLVVQGIREAKLPLASYLRAD